MERSLAVLDTDFILKIADIHTPKVDTADLFVRLMDGLACDPVVHPYVMEHELHACGLAKEMERAGKLRAISYDDFMPKNQLFYEQAFREMYHILTFEDNGEEREPDQNIYTHHAGKSYGEIHSLIMANQLQIPIFYSNDHGAKTLCRRFAAGRIQAVTMQEVKEKLAASPVCPINGKEWKYLTRKQIHT